MATKQVILGLGSNLGDRLNNLRQALRAIKQLDGVTVTQVSPVYISDAMLPDNAKPEWNIPYLNNAIRCETTLADQDLLNAVKQIETTIGREKAERWAPRTIDIDILAIDELQKVEGKLAIPHKGLLDRPFALWPLADVWPEWRFPDSDNIAAELIKKWGSRYDGDTPFHTRQINQRIDTPVIMGVVNVTPDSFSDGGKFNTVDAAVKQALHLIETGAEILDIGAESTAPNATPQTPDQEWARIEPVLTAIHKVKDQFLLSPKISIDTRHADTAKKAQAFEFVHYLNDVTGFQDAKMAQLAADTQKESFVMHHVSIPASKDNVLSRDEDVVEQVYQWADKHFSDLEKKGIKRENIIFDPGIGFGKTPEQSLALIKRVNEFTKLGCRILIGHSRKSFMAMFSKYPAPERDIETLVGSIVMLNQPVDFVRVHDVEMCARGFRVWKCMA